MTNRRKFIKTVGAVGGAGLIAGCTGGGGSGGSGGSGGDGGDGGDATEEPTATPTEEPTEVPFNDGRLTFYMSPTEPQQLMEAQYAPIRDHLEEFTGVQTRLQYAAGYSAVLQSLAGGTGDVAETGPFAAALGVNTDRCDIALQRYAYGSWEYSSVIVTQEDSDIESLSDLEGERVAFADRLSASGALFPLYMLKQAGLNIGDLPTDTGNAEFTPQFSSHAEAFAALERGQVAAAGVGKFITLDDNRELQDGFRYVETFDGIPRAPVIISPELTDAERQQVVDAFLEAPDSIYHGEDGEEGTDDDMWFSDVREATVEDYQPVVDVAVDLGIKAELLDSA